MELDFRGKLLWDQGRTRQNRSGVGARGDGESLGKDVHGKTLPGALIRCLTQVKNQLQKGVWVPDVPQERLRVSGARAGIGFIFMQIPPAVASLCQLPG